MQRREMGLTAAMVRRRLEELGCLAEFHFNETGVWLEEGARRYAWHRWREWYRPSLETREDRAQEVASMLIRSQSIERERPLT